jgi:hypothetical protein
MFTGSIGDGGNNRIRRHTQDNCPGGNSQYTCKENLATNGQNIGTDDTKTVQRTKETAKLAPAQPVPRTYAGGPMPRSLNTKPTHSTFL